MGKRLQDKCEDDYKIETETKLLTLPNEMLSSIVKFMDWKTKSQFRRANSRAMVLVDASYNKGVCIKLNSQSIAAFENPMVQKIGILEVKGLQDSYVQVPKKIATISYEKIVLGSLNSFNNIKWLIENLKESCKAMELTGFCFNNCTYHDLFRQLNPFPAITVLELSFFHTSPYSRNHMMALREILEKQMFPSLINFAIMSNSRYFIQWSNQSTRQFNVEKEELCKSVGIFLSQHGPRLLALKLDVPFVILQLCSKAFFHLVKLEQLDLNSNQHMREGEVVLNGLYDNFGHLNMLHTLSFSTASFPGSLKPTYERLVHDLYALNMGKLKLLAVLNMPQPMDQIAFKMYKSPTSVLQELKIIPKFQNGVDANEFPEFNYAMEKLSYLTIKIRTLNVGWQNRLCSWLKKVAPNVKKVSIKPEIQHLFEVQELQTLIHECCSTLKLLVLIGYKGDTEMLSNEASQWLVNNKKLMVSSSAENGSVQISVKIRPSLQVLEVGEA